MTKIEKINKLNLLTMLSKQNIKFDIYEHAALHTVEESKELRGKIEGVHTKNLFLKNKKNNFFLFSCQESTIIDLKQLKKILDLGNISFAKDLYLENIMGVKPGSVTPFGLINDQENRIKFFLDKKILYHKKVNFHPLVNTSTVSLNTKEFLLFMKNNNKLVNIFNFDNYILENG
jgi:Ala-tRNA(Pro) deacylase|tara:strand:- start:1866 stop:2390 length:525 start_codon:yes stop_codon:yes gene_type:complete